TLSFVGPLPASGKTVTDDSSRIDKATYYRCPPCGCARDTVRFTQPGQCPVCGMTLVSEGADEGADAASDSLRDLGLIGDWAGVIITGRDTSAVRIQFEIRDGSSSMPASPI